MVNNHQFSILKKVFERRPRMMSVENVKHTPDIVDEVSDRSAGKVHYQMATVVHVICRRAASEN